jgi:anaerobic nitric oxide reductase transcription regulator
MEGAVKLRLPPSRRRRPAGSPPFDAAALAQVAEAAARANVGLGEALEAFRRAYLAEALAVHRGNASAAARALGIHRNTLHKVLRGAGRGKTPGPSEAP